MSGEQPPAGLSPPAEALWWLKRGGLAVGPEWRKAHEICQSAEGDPDHDLVHALIHWIEGDMGNAAYWYRRGGGKRTATIEAEWQRIVGVIAKR